MPLTCTGFSLRSAGGRRSKAASVGGLFQLPARGRTLATTIPSASAGQRNGPSLGRAEAAWATLLEMCREQPARFRFASNGPIFAGGQGTGPLAAGCKSHLTGAITFPPPHMLTRGRWRHDLEILTTVRLSKRGARGVTRSSVRGRSPKLPSGRYPLVDLLDALTSAGRFL